MPLSDSDRRRITAFREEFERAAAGDARFSGFERKDRDDDSWLATHFEVAPRIWLELLIRPFVPEVRAGIVTDDRWRNEELEEKIEESGDTMEEFVEMGFEEAGLDWIDPPVQHRREHGTHFVFATAIELSALSQLDEPPTRERLQKMFNGYYAAFRGAIEKARVAEA